MAMIDPTGRLLEYLRQQTQEWRRQSSVAAGSSAEARSGKLGSQRDALTVAIQQIRAIPTDDPHSRRKAFRVYLASLLVQELGASVESDPGFSSLVDRVRDTMEADAHLCQAMDKAGDLLIKRAQAAS